MLETTRTYRAKILNHQQVRDDLDDCGHSASKLWNVARYHSQQEWDETGEIPSVDSVAELGAPENLGTLEVTNQLGDEDGDGEFEELYLFGARSFSSGG
jgi:hypothetical protein